MNAQEIKSAVLSGKKVFSGNSLYSVIFSEKAQQWLIVCADNGYTIGLTHRDGVTLNGNPEDFFIG
jgi:hypothetical protein